MDLRARAAGAAGSAEQAEVRQKGGCIGSLATGFFFTQHVSFGTFESGLSDVSPAEQNGFDWSGVLAGDEPPENRVTRYQAHRGAVISKHDSDLARRSGLLEEAPPGDLRLTPRGRLLSDSVFEAFV